MNKRVCVIGAGISGVATVKELRALGVEVDCYEMMPRVGGVFASHVWKGGHLTSSSVFTWFSDFPVANRQKFFTWSELLEYLDRYVDCFGLRDAIHLNSKIRAARREGGRWVVEVHRGWWSNGHPYHPSRESVGVEESVFERTYDHIVVCAGLHQRPRIPAVPGLAGFTGRCLHSSEYRDAEDFRGKRVIVVGAGESASDIALQIAQVAAKVTISARSAPGTLFPRWIQGNTPDIRDDRLTYNLPRRFAPLILRGQRRFFLDQKVRPELFRWAAESNFRNNRCPFNTNACKSFGIPEAIIDHGAELVGGLERIDGQRCHFADGASAEADTIVFCTGFVREFPFLGPELSKRLIAVNTLWKSIVDPELGDALFMVGMSRPQQINLVSVAEMQARAVAQIIAGGRALPSEAAMRATVAADQAWMSRYYGDRYTKNPALVDFLYYMDGLAKFIGCEVPFREVFRRDLHLWFKLVYSAMNGAHYRLVGPGADWDAAAATIKATPLFANRRNAIMRWTILSLVTLVSKLRGRRAPEWRLIHDQARG